MQKYEHLCNWSSKVNKQSTTVTVDVQAIQEPHTLSVLAVNCTASFNQDAELQKVHDGIKAMAFLQRRVATVL